MTSHCGMTPSDHCGRFGGFQRGYGRFMARGAAETSVARSTQRLETLEADGDSASRLAIEKSSLSVEKSGFVSRRAFVHTAKKMVREALKSLANDIGKAFETMGLDAEAGKSLVKGFMKPMVQALRHGADFTAQLRMAVVQKTTLVTGEGIAQSFSAVAKQVDISVNHDTGEISVNVQSLSIEQDSVAAFQAPALEAPALAAAPVAEGDPAGTDEAPAAPSLYDVIERTLQAAKQQSGLLEGKPAAPEADPETFAPVTFNPGIEVVLPNADAGDAADGTRIEVLRSRLRIDAAERFRNETGELITRLHVEARVSLTRMLETQPKALAQLAAAPSAPTSAYDFHA